jgi:hypothetical protein
MESVPHPQRAREGTGDGTKEENQVSLIDDYGNFMMALCVWREARGESRAAKQGVAWVIRNRFADGAAMRGIEDVVLAPHQFSSMSVTDPNSWKFPRRSQPQDWQAWIECCDVVENPGTDPTGGAIFYESFPPAMLEEVRANQSWFSLYNLTIQLGAIRFYHAS